MALPLKTLSRLTAQWASLMHAGIPLLQALQFSSQGLSDPAALRWVQRVAARIESGQALHLALSSERGVDRLYLQLVKAGERSGSLDVVLAQLAAHLTQQLAFRARWRAALHYPLIVGVVALGVVALVLTQVVPVFQSVFEQSGAPLPWPTRWLIQASQAVLNHGLSVVVGLAVMGLLGRGLWPATHRWRARMAPALWWVPVLGPLQALGGQCRFASTLSLLLQSGTPLTEALDLSVQASDHAALMQAARPLSRRVQQGVSLSQAMRRCTVRWGQWQQPAFPELLLHLVSLGEGSGQLDDMLVQWSREGQARLQARLDGLTQWLEPGVMVLMGVLVAGLVMALYLPMFEMGKAF